MTLIPFDNSGTNCYRAVDPCIDFVPGKLYRVRGGYWAWSFTHLNMKHAKTFLVRATQILVYVRPVSPEDKLLCDHLNDGTITYDGTSHLVLFKDKLIILPSHILLRRRTNTEK